MQSDDKTQGNEVKKEPQVPKLGDIELLIRNARNADVMEGDTDEIVPEEEEEELEGETEDFEEPPIEEVFPEDDPDSE